MKHHSTTSQFNQIEICVATDSRNEFFRDLRLQYEETEYLRVLDQSFLTYVTSDEFCEKQPSDRELDVFFIQETKKILNKLGSILRKEASNG